METRDVTNAIVAVRLAQKKFFKKVLAEQLSRIQVNGCHFGLRCLALIIHPNQVLMFIIPSYILTLYGIVVIKCFYHVYWGFKKTFKQSFHNLSCGNNRRRKKENGEGKEDKKEGWGQRVEPVAMGDHPNDSGTELLFREHGNTSVSLEIFLSVCIHHVKICILCECMSIS